MRPNAVLRTSLFISLLVVATAATAEADAVADFRAGRAVAVDAATVDLGNGPRSSTGTAALVKTTGSLDVTLAAADLGIALPITLRLRGSTPSPGRIEFTINQAFSPAVDLGGGQALKQITGRLVLSASPQPGGFAQTIGNARLRLAAPGRLTATGTFGTMAIAVEQLELVGGIRQPAFTGFRDPSRTTICSDRVRTSRTLEVGLASNALGTGAAVELHSANRAGVAVPSAVVVRPGRRTGTVTVQIAPNFVGTVRLTASAGAVVRSLALTINPRSVCPR